MQNFFCEIRTKPLYIYIYIVNKKMSKFEIFCLFFTIFLPLDYEKIALSISYYKKIPPHSLLKTIRRDNWLEENRSKDDDCKSDRPNLANHTTDCITETVTIRGLSTGTSLIRISFNNPIFFHNLISFHWI